ncbi:MAG TPA: PH domain-containing protein [Streptosporangiaceae bacterium]|nr:PH domain-containing protein [Streptosporangiaceae bacterium]
MPNEQTRSTGTPPTTAGRVTADGKRLFRMTGPQVIWWGWVGIIVISLGDLAIQGHEFISLKIAFAGLAICGFVYACTLWPVVIADERGLTVRNPFRTVKVPWVAVHGIYLADSVEVQCARRPPKKDKTVYTWALASPRRARARAQLRAWQWDQGKRNRPSGYAALPHEAKSIARLTTVEIMARELAVLSDEARFKSVVHDVEISIDDVAGADSDDSGAVADAAGAAPDVAAGATGTRENAPELPAGPLTADDVASAHPPAGPAEVMAAGWSWPPVLAIVLPAIGFAVCFLVR